MNNDFVRANFDKLLMLSVFFVSCLLVVFFAHYPGNSTKALDFAVGAATGAMASLITLLQRAFAERKTDVVPDTRQVTSRTETVETVVAKTVPTEEEKETNP